MAVGGGGWGVVCQTVEGIADSQLGVADSSLTREPPIAGKFDQVAQFANLPTNASFTSLVNIIHIIFYYRRPAWWKDFLLVACHCIVNILY